jgi:hypothetical protein
VESRRRQTSLQLFSLLTSGETNPEFCFHVWSLGLWTICVSFVITHWTNERNWFQPSGQWNCSWMRPGPFCFQSDRTLIHNKTSVAQSYCLITEITPTPWLPSEGHSTVQFDHIQRITGVCNVTPCGMAELYHCYCPILEQSKGERSFKQDEAEGWGGTILRRIWVTSARLLSIVAAVKWGTP